MYTEIIKSSIPNTYSKIYDSVVNTKSRISATHLHDEIEIMYVMDGCIKWTFQNDTVLVDKNECIFVNFRVPHETECVSVGASVFVIQFHLEKLLSDPSQDTYLKRFINNNEKPYFHFTGDNKKTIEFIQYVRKIQQEYFSSRKAMNIYVKAYIFSIIGFMYRNNYLLEPSLINIDVIEKIMPALNFVNNNFQNQITLRDASEYLDLNPSYLCRLFKKATSSTFIKYLNFVRISNSQTLLTTTNDSILEIALSVGFSNISYFNRTFKSYTGCTPNLYRNSYIRK